MKLFKVPNPIIFIFRYHRFQPLSKLVILMMLVCTTQVVQSRATESREVESFIKVWPNPVDNEIFVEALSLKGILELYDTKGVQKLTMSFTGKQAEIDVSGFLPGIYILVLRTEKNVYSYKINIQ